MRSDEESKKRTKKENIKKEFRESCRDVFNRPNEETSLEMQKCKKYKIFFVFYKLGELGKQI